MLTTDEPKDPKAKNEEPKDPRAKRDGVLTLGIEHTGWAGELHGEIYESVHVFKCSLAGWSRAPPWALAGTPHGLSGGPRGASWGPRGGSLAGSGGFLGAL